jgi:hypothetical protein
LLGTTRSLILVAIAIVVLGCQPGPGRTNSMTVAPTATPTAAPATATAPPAPSLPTVTPGPSDIAACSRVDELDLAGIEVTFGSVDEDGNGGNIGFSLGPTNAELQVTRVIDSSGRCLMPPSQELLDQRGQILGGHEFITYPSTSFHGLGGPQAMLAARVTLTLKGGTAIDLPTRFVPGNENFDQVAITVPDVAGPGVLRLEFVWSDRFFRYEGSSAITVDVVPLSATEGCALDSSGYFDQVGDLLRRSIEVDSVPQVAFSPFNTSKFTPFVNEGIDAMIVYAFDPDQPSITAMPGAALRIEDVSDELTLGKEMDLWVWTRASVVKAVRDYPPEGTVLVLSRTPVQQAERTFGLRVPQDPGRYVAGVQLTYDSQCSSGTLWFVVNVDVVGS